MRALIQRVTHAHVSVEGEVVGEIGPGLCVLIGITHTDGSEQVEKIAKKIAQLKILRNRDGDDEAKSRMSAEELQAPILLVSQFTLYADVRKGRKPSWSHAASGEIAQPLFNDLVAAVQSYGLPVSTGEFGAMMQVELVNDGPFTIWAEC